LGVDHNDTSQEYDGMADTGYDDEPRDEQGDATDQGTKCYQPGECYTQGEDGTQVLAEAIRVAIDKAEGGVHHQQKGRCDTDDGQALTRLAGGRIKPIFLHGVNVAFSRKGGCAEMLKLAGR
jgi:hypothetical protein